MSQRVRLTHGLNTGFLIMLAVFGVAMIGIGMMVAVFAETIHNAQPETSTTQWYIAGAITTLIGVVMMRPIFGGWGAVSYVDVQEDGSWELISRFGRSLSTVDHDEERAFQLHGATTIVVSTGLMPSRREMVRGFLVFGEGDYTYKLAQASPEIYDDVLSELGYDAAAPRPGEELNL